MIIDLDNTIYPESSGLMQAISEQIDDFIQTILGFSPSETKRLRMYFKQNYGTTLQGLHDLYQIDKDHYLAFVHDIDLKKYLKPNKKLKEILKAYPQRKIIFSNADKNHIHNVLNFYGIENLFDSIIDVHAIAPYVKPQKESFKKLSELLRLCDWSGCIFIDDYFPNIQAAASQGLFCIQVNESMNSEYPRKVPSIINLPQLIPINSN